MIRSLKIVFFSLILTLIISCEKKQHEQLILKSEIIIKTIPSASGVICKDGHLWMVGDDASFLFEVDSNNKTLNQYQISFMNRQEGGRLLKSIKPDFEAMDYFDDIMLIIGSGSKEVSRDTAILFDMKNKQIIAKTSFRPLYNKLLEIGDFDSTQQINMEGLASDAQYFYLLQRGNVCGKNLVFQMKKQELLNYFENGEIPHIVVHHFNLPKIDDYLSGFSGACISPDKKKLLFTASVESTSDVYHDGEVLGSFVGWVSIVGEQAWKNIHIHPLTKDDSILKTKLESVCVINQRDNEYELVCVSDNDNGESGIYKLLLYVGGKH